MSFRHGPSGETAMADPSPATRHTSIPQQERNAAEANVPHHPAARSSSPASLLPESSNNGDNNKTGRHRIACPFPTRTKPLYENCSVYGPDGETLLFRCSRKKIDWYLTRSLAQRLSADSIALTFTPRGTGRANQPWYLESKTNTCVICGADAAGGLVMVSVVPHQYRRHFPLCIKSHSHQDTLPTCAPCHMTYDKHVQRTCKVIANHYSIPLGGGPWIERKEWMYAKKAAGALLMVLRRRRQTGAGGASKGQIPEKRMAELARRVRVGLGLSEEQEVTEEQLLAAVELPDAERGPGFKEHGLGVVEKVIEERAKVVWEMLGVHDTVRLGTGVKCEPSGSPTPARLLNEDEDAMDVDGDEHGNRQAATSRVERPVPLPAEVDPLVAFVVMWRKHFLDVAQPRNMSPHYDMYADVYNH